MGNDGTPATVAREGEAMTVERDEARARTASDTEVLTELLASPWEQVRAAAAVIPAAPAGAASGSYTPTSGPTLLSALALSPGLSQDDRNEIYLRVAEREDRDRNDGRASTFWLLLAERMAEIGRKSESEAVLAALSRSTSHRVMLAVALNRCASTDVRRHLRHWSAPVSVRITTFMRVGRRAPSPETLWTLDLAAALAIGIRMMAVHGSAGRAGPWR